MKRIVGLAIIISLAGSAPAQSVNLPNNYGASFPIPNPAVVMSPVLDPADFSLGLRSRSSSDELVTIPTPLGPNRSVVKPGVVNPDDPAPVDIENPPLRRASDAGIDGPVLIPIPVRPNRSVVRPSTINPDDPAPTNPYAVVRPSIINPDDIGTDIQTPPSVVRPGIINPDDQQVSDVPAIEEGRYPLSRVGPNLALDVRSRSPFFSDRIELAFGPSLVGRTLAAELYDMSGRQLLRSALRAGASSTLSSPLLRALPAGNYLLKLTCDCGPDMYRLLKVSKPLD